MHNGLFEVVKSSDLTGDGDFLAQRGSLDVVVPTELEGAAYIQVEVKSVPGNCLTCVTSCRRLVIVLSRNNKSLCNVA